jgi:hypothetical protein
MTSTIVSYHISEPNEYLVITGGKASLITSFDIVWCR